MNVPVSAAKQEYDVDREWFSCSARAGCGLNRRDVALGNDLHATSTVHSY